MREPIYFKCSIDRIQIENFKLKSKNGFFIKLYFDEHERAISDVVSKSGNVLKWSIKTNFFYNEEFTMIHTKMMKIELWMKEEENLVGFCYVPIVTLASGPARQKLPFMSPKKRVLGTIAFSLVMDQIKTVNMGLNVTVEGKDRSDGNGLGFSIKVYRKKSRARAIEQRAIVENGAVDFKRVALEQICYKDLRNSIVNIRLSVIDPENEGSIMDKSSCQIQLGDFLTLERNKSYLQICNLVYKRVNVGTLTCNVNFTDLPKFGQVSHGVHIPKRIIGGKMIPGAMLPYIDGKLYENIELVTPSSKKKIKSSRKSSRRSQKKTQMMRSRKKSKSNGYEYENKAVKPLPLQFERRESNSKFYETITGLPDGWSKLIDEDGREFYANHLEKRTQWEHPGLALLPKKSGRRKRKSHSKSGVQSESLYSEDQTILETKAENYSRRRSEKTRKSSKERRSSRREQQYKKTRGNSVSIINAEDVAKIRLKESSIRSNKSAPNINEFDQVSSNKEDKKKLLKELNFKSESSSDDSGKLKLLEELNFGSESSNSYYDDMIGGKNLESLYLNDIEKELSADSASIEEIIFGLSENDIDNLINTLQSLNQLESSSEDETTFVQHQIAPLEGYSSEDDQLIMFEFIDEKSLEESQTELEYPFFVESSDGEYYHLGTKSESESSDDSDNYSEHSTYSEHV